MIWDRFFFAFFFLLKVYIFRNCSLLKLNGNSQRNPFSVCVVMGNVKHHLEEKNIYSKEQEGQKADVMVGAEDTGRFHGR